MANNESMGREKHPNGPALAGGISHGAGIGVALGAGIGVALGSVAGDLPAKSHYKIGIP